MSFLLRIDAGLDVTVSYRRHRRGEGNRLCHIRALRVRADGITARALEDGRVAGALRRRARGPAEGGGCDTRPGARGLVPKAETDADGDEHEGDPVHRGEAA